MYIDHFKTFLLILYIFCYFLSENNLFPLNFSVYKSLRSYKKCFMLSTSLRLTMDHSNGINWFILKANIFIYFFNGWWHLVAFIDHYTHWYEIVRHQFSYMQLYNTQLITTYGRIHFCAMSSRQCIDWIYNIINSNLMLHSRILWRTA